MYEDWLKHIAQVSHGRGHDLFVFDREVLRQAGRGMRFLAGADEVGRGCLAGPLVCAAVVLDYGGDPERVLSGLNDSKKLSRSERERLFPCIVSNCRCWTVVSVSPGTIDRAGLHRSNREALASALRGVQGMFDLALVDGRELGEVHADHTCLTLVGADHLSAAVAAASIVAKVLRDRLMCAMHGAYPDYGFDRHVGYATSAHLEALLRAGPCALHRLSFQGVKEPAQMRLSLDQLEP